MIPLIKKTLSPRWPTWLLVLLTLFIPLQYRFYKIFKPLSRALSEQQLPLPLYFERNFCFYLTDLLVLSLSLRMLFDSQKNFLAFFLDKGGKYLILLLGFALVSISLSSSSNYSLQYFRLFQLALPFLLFCSLANGRPLKETIPKIFWCFVSLALFECAIGIIQYFTQNEVGLRFLGEPKLHSKEQAAAHFLMSDGSKWVIDRLFHLSSGPAVLLRAPGTFPHPNVFGGFLVLSSLISYCLYCWVDKKELRWLLGASIPLQLFTLCLTFSRAALFGWFFATALWLLLFLRKEMADFRPKLKSLTPLILGSGVLCLLLLYPQFLERGGIVNYNTVSHTSDHERIVYQEVALKMAKQNPFFGVGFNNFLLEMERFIGGGERPILFQVPHNMYLLLLSEVGVPGLCLFLLFIASTLLGALRGEKTLFSLTLLALFFAFLWLGACDYYPLITQHGNLLFFMIAGLLASFSKRALEVSQIRAH